MKEILEATLEKLFADQLQPEQLIASEQTQWQAPLWTLIEDSGFSLAMVPEALGGAQASWHELVGVIELCGKFCLPLPLPESIFANWLLGCCGAEPITGPVSIAAEHNLTVHNGKVTGEMRNVPWGRSVSQVVAVIAGEQPRVVVMAPSASCTVTETTNIAGEPRDHLQFEQAVAELTVPLAAGLTEQVVLLGGAMLRTAQISGALAESMLLATSYVNERVQFGRPLAKFQVVQHQLAVLAEHAAATRVAVQAAFAQSSGALAELALMTAKIVAAEAAGIGASTAHGVHGAIGFTHEYRLHLLTRRLWSWRSEFGSEVYWAEQLGQAVCRAGAEQYWPTITRQELSA